MDEDVKECTGDLVFATSKPCPFYEYRMGDKRIPVRVFRRFCLECMGGRQDFVSECETSCPIHPYRFGKNPARKGQGASKEAMQKARESKLKRQKSTSPGQSIGESPR
jgi:hypothetical protein